MLRLIVLRVFMNPLFISYNEWNIKFLQCYYFIFNGFTHGSKVKN